MTAIVKNILLKKPPFRACKPTLDRLIQALGTLLPCALKSSHSHPTLIEPLESRQMLSVITADSSSEARTFFDSQHNKIVFNLTGPGELNFYADIAGNNRLILSGSNSATTSLNIVVIKDTSEGTGVTTFSSINLGAGGINTLNAANVNITGAVTSDGAVASLVLGDIHGTDGQQAQVTIGAYHLPVATDFDPFPLPIHKFGANLDHMTMKLGALSEVSIKTDAIVTSFEALDWQDNDATPDQFTASALGTFTITGHNKAESAALHGDLEADITLTAAPAMTLIWDPTYNIDGDALQDVTRISIVGNTSGNWNLGYHKLDFVSIGGDASGNWSSIHGFGFIVISGSHEGLTYNSSRTLPPISSNSDVVAPPGTQRDIITAKSTPQQRTFVDTAHNKIVFTITGPGTIQWDHNTISGFSALKLLDSDPTKTTLTITVTKDTPAATGMSHFTFIDLGAGAKVVNAPKVAVDLSLTSKGAVGSLTLGDVGLAYDQAQVTLGGTKYDHTVLNFGVLTDVNIHSDSVVTSFQAINWLDHRNIIDQFEAVAVGTFTITGRAETKSKGVVVTPGYAGNMEADIHLTGTPVQSLLPDRSDALRDLSRIAIHGSVSGNWDLGYHQLKTAVIGGNASGHWSSITNIGPVTISGNANDLAVASTRGSIASFKAAHVSDTSLVASRGSIGAVTALDWSSGGINALKITSINITGAVNDSTWNIHGNIGNVTVGAFLGSSLWADTTTGLTTIGSFIVTGRAVPAGKASFARSMVRADTLTRVSLQRVDTQDGAPYGVIATRKIGTYSRVTSQGTTLQVKNKTAPGTYDTAGQFTLKLLLDPVIEG